MRAETTRRVLENYAKRHLCFALFQSSGALAHDSDSDSSSTRRSPATTQRQQTDPQSIDQDLTSDSEAEVQERPSQPARFGSSNPSSIRGGAGPSGRGTQPQAPRLAGGRGLAPPSNQNTHPSSVGDASAVATRGGRRRLLEEVDSTSDSEDDDDEVYERPSALPSAPSSSRIPPPGMGGSRGGPSHQSGGRVPPSASWSQNQYGRAPSVGGSEARFYSPNPMGPGGPRSAMPPPSESNAGGPGSVYSAAREQHYYHHGGSGPQGNRPSVSGPAGGSVVPYASSVGGRSGGRGGPGSAVGAPSAAAIAPAGAPRAEVEAALQSIQASLAALHERLSRVETRNRAPFGLSSLLFPSASTSNQVGSSTGGAGRGNGNGGRRGALRSAYSAVTNALHDIAQLLGLASNNTAQGTAPPSYLANASLSSRRSNAGGDIRSGIGGNSSSNSGTVSTQLMSAPLRLFLALLNLAARLALDVTSVALLLSFTLFLLHRITGRGDPYFVIRLLRWWSRRGGSKAIVAGAVGAVGAKREKAKALEG